MTQREKTLNQISLFFQDEKTTPEIITKCDSIAEEHKKKSQNAMISGKRNYPHGYSGKINVWKDYFSKEHLDDYNIVINKFLNSYPNASLLLDICPEILNHNFD